MNKYKMKKTILMLMVLILLLSITSCRDPNQTNDKYIEDFDYMYNFLKESFPYFGVAQRVDGVDIEELATKARSQIEKMRAINDDIFAGILAHFFKRLKNIGHLEVIDTLGYYSDLALLEDPQNEQWDLWAIKDMDDPWFLTATNYLELLHDPGVVNAYYSKYYEDTKFYSPNNGNNINTKILENGKIAYLSINNFNSNVSYDRQELLNFYEQVADYENLIIDITRNPGGFRSYFAELVVAPNIAAPVTYSFYAFANSSTEAFKERSPLLNEVGVVFQPIDDNLIGTLPYLNADDMKQLDVFSYVTETIYPSEPKKIFNGKIWLLTDTISTSGANYAAQISKQTGFAIVVGRPANYGGIGRGGAFIVLPNTALLIKYEPFYCTDPYGRNVYEYGTEPDVSVQTNTSPLDAALQLIKGCQ